METTTVIPQPTRGTATPTRTGESLWTRLLATEHNWPLFLLRVTLAVVIFPHGAQKLFGWFGGYGYSGTMGFFQSLGIPYIFGLLAIIAEFFGALALLTGFLGRIAATGIASVMVVAVATTHLSNGFFMNWAGNQAGEGFEYHLLALGISLAVMVWGSGALSVDRKLAQQTNQ